MTTIFALCPACNACPTVEINDHEVRIGEGDNVVKLTPAEWNVLVQAIKAGELNQVTRADKGAFDVAKSVVVHTGSTYGP